MDAIKITGAEYIKQYYCAPGLLLLIKDMPPEKTGTLIIPNSVRDSHANHVPTAIVAKIPIFKFFEDEYTENISGVIKEGDRIGYNPTAPFFSPSPLYYIFEPKERDLYITIHVKDYVNHINDTEEKRREFESRVEQWRVKQWP